MAKGGASLSLFDMRSFKLPLSKGEIAPEEGPMGPRRSGKNKLIIVYSFFLTPGMPFVNLQGIIELRVNV